MLESKKELRKEQRLSRNSFIKHFVKFSTMSQGTGKRNTEKKIRVPMGPISEMIGALSPIDK